VPEFSRYTLEIIRDNLFVIPQAEAPARSQPISVRPSTRRSSKKASRMEAAAQVDEPPVAEPVSELKPARTPSVRPAEPAATPAPRHPEAEIPEEIQEARRLDEQGEWATALAEYNRMAQAGQHLDWIIEDLTAASQAHPQDIDLWQNLGDAYLRANRLKDAMQAYSRAEKLLR